MDFEKPPADPVAQFHIWLEEAKRTALPNPNAMTLATVDPDGAPSARIVLLKSLNEAGAVFFTNYESDKARALAAHAHACLLFHWDPLNRQVRITGGVERISVAESDAYFASRPRESRLGAWASLQSQPVGNRMMLEARLREMEARFPEDIPRPPHWGGFRVALKTIEFWQGHVFRLHDRVRYSRAGVSWSVQRLYP